MGVIMLKANEWAHCIRVFEVHELRSLPIVWFFSILKKKSLWKNEDSVVKWISLLCACWIEFCCPIRHGSPKSSRTIMMKNFPFELTSCSAIMRQPVNIHLIPLLSSDTKKGVQIYIRSHSLAGISFSTAVSKNSSPKLAFIHCFSTVPGFKTQLFVTLEAINGRLFVWKSIVIPAWLSHTNSS